MEFSKPLCSLHVPRFTSSIFVSAMRGIALLLGAFTVWNVFNEWRHPGFDANLWWIDLRFTNASFRNSTMLVTGFMLLAFAWKSRFTFIIRWGITTGLSMLVIVAAFNTWTFFRVLMSRQIETSFPIPLSAVMSAVLLAILCAISFAARAPSFSETNRPAYVFAMIAGAFLFPLAQMYCFGSTDYRRKAELIVVFGCLVHSDGTPSQALADRVRTGAELYHAGHAPRLVFSGGPGPGTVHETDAMRRLAMELGVPSDAITLDRTGFNTQATVQNLIEFERQEAIPRVLAVSHFYHLPRIKLSFRRGGWDVYTVPAKETRHLAAMPWFLFREVLALWWYYIRGG